MKKVYNVLFLELVVLFFIFQFIGKTVFLNQSTSSENSGYLSLFYKVSELVETQYVEEVDPTHKFPGAFSSELSNLDRFSAYLDTKHTQLYQRVESGNFCGLGIFGIPKRGYFVITDIIPSSPADKSGLEIGDVIKSINEKSTFSLSFWEIYLDLLSEKPIEIELEFNKRGSSGFEKKVLKTKAFSFQPEIQLVKKNFFFVNLKRFDTLHVDKMKKHFLQHPNRRWIIDLRRYCGGDFSSFLELTKIFIHKEMRLRLLIKKSTEDFIVGAENSVANRCVFIMNASTMWYAELLAQLLKENKEVLIGEKTPGYLTKLQQFFLDDGSSILITVGFFQLNQHLSLNSGVEPDITVQTSDEERLLSECVKALN